MAGPVVPVPARPVPVRDAASLVITRQADEVVQVLLGKRRSTQAFVPGKFVFPGGAVDPDDVALAALSHLVDGTLAPVERQRLSAATPDGAPSADVLALAAVREAFEEAGVWIASPPVLAAGGAGLDSLTQGAAPPGWAPFLAQGLRPWLPPLRMVGRAITPPGPPRRFDARFLHADASAALFQAGGEAEGGDGEFESLAWMTFTEAYAHDLHDVTRAILEHVQARLQPGRELAPVSCVPFLRDCDGIWTAGTL